MSAADSRPPLPLGLRVLEDSTVPLGGFERRAADGRRLLRVENLGCACGHSALAHDSGGGCTVCSCRGFRT